MSANPPPASPAVPRSASTGPNGPLPTPTTNAVVNGVGSATGTASTTATTGTTPALSQQNLNQIVSVFDVMFCSSRNVKHEISVK